jgi:hypothetical protein
MILLDEYIQYFQYLAQHNAQIADVPTMGRRTFDVLPQEALNEEKFRSEFSATTPFYFAVVSPSISEMEDVTDRDGRADVFGGFLILKKHSPRQEKPNEWRVCQTETFELSKNILRRMVRDSRNKHPLFSRSIDAFINLRPSWIPKYGMGQGETYSGYLVTFHFETFISMLLTPVSPESANWTDSGVTPY